MQKIVPSIWFDRNAAEAAEFYTSLFPDSRVTDTQYYPTEGLPDFQRDYAGQVLAVQWQLAGYRFLGINSGPEYPVTPAISLMLNFDPSRDDDARAHLDETWTALAENGSVLMPLGEYPFSPHYGWLQDRYGVNWQLMLTDPDGEPRPFIIPSLLFGAAAQNRAEEALEFYQSVFPDARVGTLVRYPEQTGPAAADAVMFSDLEVFGQWLSLMDSGVEQTETFSPGLSLTLECADQAEIDHYWALLSTVPEAEQCGWCVDPFGVSWQVQPANMAELTRKPEAYFAMLEMKKIEIDKLG